MQRNHTSNRRHASWLAFFIHRLSGVLLLLFLPLHFWTLGLALDGEASLDQALRWYDAPLFRAGEWALVALLAVHLLGGLRILLIEFRPWQGLRRGWIAGSVLGALAVSFLFLIVSRT